MQRKLIAILFFVLIFFTAKSQSPVGLPSVNSPTGYYNIGWLRGDSGIINAIRDTTVRSKYGGLQVMWQHNGVDTNVWFYDGRAYFRYLKTGQDVFNAIGGIPMLSLTTNGTSGPATFINGVLNIPVITGGGGGGNIVSLNGNTAAVQFLTPGTSGSDFNLVASGNNTITFNLPTAGPFTRGVISTSDWNTFNTKQAQLNGTGFVKASGTTITYDNSTYYLASNPNGYINYSQLSALPPILYNGAGVYSADTTPGLTHLATQAYVGSHGGSGINVVGNLSPLFNSTVISNNLSFSFINAAAYNVFANFTGSPGPPSYGLLTTNNFAAIAGSRLLGNPNGSAATPSLISLGYGFIFTGTTLAFDSAHVKDTVFAVNGLSAYGLTGDSIGLGGNLFQNTSINLHGVYSLVFANAAPGGNKGFRVDLTNNGTDAGWDMFTKDSATGFWGRIPKGTPGQSLQMLPGGGIGWAAQAGGGGGGVALDAPQTITTGTSITVTNGVNVVLFNPATTISAYSLTFPATPHNGDYLTIVFGGTITSGPVVTTLTCLANGGQSLNAVVTSATGYWGIPWTWKFYNNVWYRIS